MRGAGRRAKVQIYPCADEPTANPSSGLIVSLKSLLGLAMVELGAHPEAMPFLACPSDRGCKSTTPTNDHPKALLPMCPP